MKINCAINLNYLKSWEFSKRLLNAGKPEIDNFLLFYCCSKRLRLSIPVYIDCNNANATK